MSKNSKFKSTCIADLERFAVTPLHGQKLYQLCNRLSYLWDHGQQAKCQNDYERVYIYFRRWLCIVDWIKGLPEYTEEKSHFDSYFGNNNYYVAVAEIKDVVKQLQEHYKTLQSETFADEKINTGLKKNPESRICNEITCTQLYNLFKCGNRVIVFDVRTEEEYKTSKILVFDTRVIHIPADLIKTGVCYSYYEKHLKTSNEHQLYKELKKVDTIVLMEKRPSKNSLKLNSPLQILRSTLEDVDPVTISNKLSILKGGYSEWANTFPWFTIGSQEMLNIPEALVTYR